jgi:hypothetical protein
MASLTDRKDGTKHTGKTPESIARRVWGKSAEVRRSADPNEHYDGCCLGLVTKTNKYGTHVLARVVIRDND